MSDEEGDFRGKEEALDSEEDEGNDVEPVDYEVGSESEEDDDAMDVGAGKRRKKKQPEISAEVLRRIEQQLPVTETHVSIGLKSSPEFTTMERYKPIVSRARRLRMATVLWSCEGARQAPPEAARLLLELIGDVMQKNAPDLPACCMILCSTLLGESLVDEEHVLEALSRLPGAPPKNMLRGALIGKEGGIAQLADEIVDVRDPAVIVAAQSPLEVQTVIEEFSKLYPPATADGEVIIAALVSILEQCRAKEGIAKFVVNLLLRREPQRFLTELVLDAVSKSAIRYLHQNKVGERGAMVTIKIPSVKALMDAKKQQHQIEAAKQVLRHTFCQCSQLAPMIRCVLECNFQELPTLCPPRPGVFVRQIKPKREVANFLEAVEDLSGLACHCQEGFSWTLGQLHMPHNGSLVFFDSDGTRVPLQQEWNCQENLRKIAPTVQECILDVRLSRDGIFVVEDVLSINRWCCMHQSYRERRQILLLDFAFNLADGFVYPQFFEVTDEGEAWDPLQETSTHDFDYRSFVTGAQGKQDVQFLELRTLDVGAHYDTSKQQSDGWVRVRL